MLESSRACLSRWAPFVRNHGSGQGQLPMRSDYGPWVLDSNARGSTRPTTSLVLAEARCNVFHAAGGLFEQTGEAIFGGDCGLGREKFTFQASDGFLELLDALAG